jgi:predicted YcjX-like family ATPase
MSRLPLADEIGLALSTLADSATGALNPTLRLGVTGLSRSGKTVFITALVHSLLTGSGLYGFAPSTEARLIGAQLVEHPDATIPRFAYEQHIATLTGRPSQWPESTRRISQLRIRLKFTSDRITRKFGGPATLNLDIVDYPGEWLLDLPLLDKSFAQWSAEALARAEAHGSEARPFLDVLAATNPAADARDTDAELLAQRFTDYLRAAREDGRALSSLPPGRFLLPGDLEGSPALTFAPLPSGSHGRNSLYARLESRYEAYKQRIVRPFLRDHFLRLDRQVVLVDVLRALNAGPDAVRDLETALSEVLTAFRQGEINPLNRLVSRRIDRILFAATKADLLHNSSHDRLEAILNRLVASATRRARFAGAQTRSLAIAAIRATREGTIREGGDTLPTIVGTPEAGQRLDGTTYDGKTEIALFPGDLPVDAESALQQRQALNFLRFTPPEATRRSAGGEPVFAHIRLDRALDYLIGDWMR